MQYVKPEPPINNSKILIWGAILIKIALHISPYSNNFSIRHSRELALLSISLEIDKPAIYGEIIERSSWKAIGGDFLLKSLFLT